jgi:hypothetical protein
MGIKIECNSSYCYRVFRPDAPDAKEWKCVEVRVDRNEEGTEVSVDICVWPLDPEKINSLHGVACPEHWRAVARDLASDVEFFQDPPRPVLKDSEPYTAPDVPDVDF